MKICLSDMRAIEESVASLMPVLPAPNAGYRNTSYNLKQESTGGCVFYAHKPVYETVCNVVSLKSMACLVGLRQRAKDCSKLFIFTLAWPSELWDSGIYSWNIHEDVLVDAFRTRLSTTKHVAASRSFCCGLST